MKPLCNFSSRLAVVSIGLFLAGCVSNPIRTAYDEGRKVEVTVLPSVDRVAHVMTAGARQVNDDVLVHVRVNRQGTLGIFKPRALRLALVNSDGLVEHSTVRRISATALNRRGAGYQWLTLSVPHTMAPGDKLLLSLGPVPQV